MKYHLIEQWLIKLAKVGIMMTPRKAVDKELTRNMIIEAAQELFVQKGFQHVSMRQIATKLGYSHGSIYYHFKNKAELFYAIVVQDFKLLDQVLENVLNKEELDPNEKLKKILLAFIEFGLTHHSHYEMMFMIKDEEVRGYIQQEPNLSYEKFAKAVYSLSGKGGPQLIWSLFLALHGFVSHYIRNGSTFHEVENLAKSHVDFVLKAFL